MKVTEVMTWPSVGSMRCTLRWQNLPPVPHRFGFAPENGKWLPEHEIRQMLFRPWKSGVGWRVLFTIDEEQKLVTVLQVRHEHRRWFFEADET